MPAVATRMVLVAGHRQRGLGRGLALVVGRVGLRPRLMVHCLSRSVCRARTVDQLSGIPPFHWVICSSLVNRAWGASFRSGGAVSYQPKREFLPLPYVLLWPKIAQYLTKSSFNQQPIS